jgi:hypothetical protein
MTDEAVPAVPAELEVPASNWLVPTLVEIFCLLAAILIYLLSLAGISSLGGSDSLGNSLSSAFAVVVEFVLWLPILAFIALSCRAGRQSGNVLAVGLVLGVVAMVLCLWAIGLMERPNWVRITPAALPPLALLFGAWARFSGRWPTLWRRLSAGAFLLLFAAGIAPVFVEQQRQDAAAPAREAARQKVEADYARSEAEAKARYEAEFHALGSDSRLEQLLPYVMSEFETQALAKIRSLSSRQADAVRLLDGGAELSDFRRLPEYNIEATPELCRAYRARIDSKIGEFSPTDPGNDPSVELETHFDVIRWFQANGCDMASQAARIANMLRRHPNDWVRSRAAEFATWPPPPNRPEWTP